MTTWDLIPNQILHLEQGTADKGRVFGFFAVEGDKALVGDGTAIDSNVTLGRFSGRLETPEESFSLPGWDEA